MTLSGWDHICKHVNKIFAYPNLRYEQDCILQVLKCSKRRRFVVATICPSAAAPALCCCCVHGGSFSLLPQLLRRVIADRDFVDNFRAI